MLKRRRIRQWASLNIAAKDYECTKCDTRICAGTSYERDVLATSRNIEVERTHSRPACADTYYIGR
jgi:hypothetical protein